MAPPSSPDNQPRGAQAPNEQANARLARLHALVEAEPADTFCLYGLAQEYARRGRWDEAIAWYDRCLATDPAYCYAYFHKAKALEGAGRPDEARASLEAGLSQARRARDQHAAAEIEAYLDELT